MSPALTILLNADLLIMATKEARLPLKAGAHASCVPAGANVGGVLQGPDRHWLPCEQTLHLMQTCRAPDNHRSVVQALEQRGHMPTEP